MKKAVKKPSATIYLLLEEVPLPFEHHANYNAVKRSVKASRNPAQRKHDSSVTESHLEHLDHLCAPVRFLELFLFHY